MDTNLEHIRHSTAHLLAGAIQILYPKALPTIGPAVENGFYYDFDFGDTKISEEDFAKIENKMREILKNWQGFEKTDLSAEEAKKMFADNPYKLELIGEISTKGEQITTYKSGDFIDLCRGGHVENPKDGLKNFRLTKVAGAYWRGDEKNKMLTRIYGIAFDTKEALEEHLKMLEVAKKRDHKVLGPALDLFTFSELVGSGLPLWTPKGTMLRNLLDEFVWSLRSRKGYEKVEIPHITKKDLYEKSGHWDKFKDELFRIKTREGHEFAMKPMNCPHHTQIFARKAWSYREMPQRYANTTMCYRDEQSGELSGLSRVRAFAQDDAHVFCRISQVKDEFIKVWDIINDFYAVFGFDLKVRLSLHDPKSPEKYLGSLESWNESEQTLREIALGKGVEFYEGIGEAAFYGPKIDFMTSDSLGRSWQVATIQLDLNMPERFDLYCTSENGDKERIVMIHAAIMGSIDRFLSILIEHTAGNFPLWLSPVQIIVAPISDKHLEAGRYAHELLLKNGIRSVLDDSNKTLGAKIRQQSLQKIPLLGIIGDKELTAGTKSDIFMTIRERNGNDIGQINLAQLIVDLKEKIETKSNL